MPPPAPSKSSPRGTDGTAMDFRRLLPEIRWQSRLSPGSRVVRSFPFAVNGSLGIVVAPVEPVILKHWNWLQAQPFRLPRSRAALEVPLAPGRVVNQQDTRFSGDPVAVGGSAHPGATVAERPPGLILGPHCQQRRLGTPVALDQLFLNPPLIEKPPAGAERLDSQHQIASRQPVLRKTQDGGLTLHLYIPVSLGVVGPILRDIVQYGAPRLFRFPGGERQLIGVNQRQLAALERTRNGRARDLLPIGPSLLVAHEEVLVIDAGQMKRQPQAVNLSRPHQTGVT